ncbi:hypothetical protein VdG2_03917 [Verticillium dahliae VDG2]|nr:hypothetical protein VdG2_03917 [Verticillium dahliae VDG2]
MSLPRGLSSVLKKSPSDVVILSSLRTPICRSYRGQLKDAYPEELLSVVLRATLDANPNLDPAAIEEVAVGVVLSELGGSKAAKMALNHVGYPSTTTLYTVNRACSSSLQSIALVAAQIRTDVISVGIGAGMESMTRNYGSKAIPVDLWPALKASDVKDARDCIMPMGLTSENVAARYGVTATALGLSGSILGKFVGATTSGCAPDEMGIGPVLAIPKILGQLGLTTEDVDRWEINEAFASQAIYSVRALGLEKAWQDGRVNPDGGAIALGHPLGATGARMASTLLHGLGRTGGDVGVVSMCVGTGMGMAGVFVRE